MKDNEIAGRIISSLNKASFHRFVYELWKADNIESKKIFIEATKKKNLGEGVFEQHWIKYDKIDRSKSDQGFNLILPFEQPIELLRSNGDFKLFFENEISILRKYYKSIKRKTNKWYFPQDGSFNASSISFVSNIYGVEKQTYFEKILPKLHELIAQYDYFNNVLIGTCDSFLDSSPSETISIIKQLFFNDAKELSFFWEDGKIYIQQHISENFLKSGILSKPSSPFDTAITFPTLNNLEIYREFEFLLNRNYSEKELELFITKYYKVIFGNKYDSIETELWLRFPELDINKKNRKVDIFLRNAIERDWELIELKAAGKIISNYRDVPTLSSRISGAISQLKNYQRILQQDSVKRKLAQQGIEYYEPQTRLVIGGTPNISVNQWRRIKAENEKDLKITTLDELLQEMKFRHTDFENFL